MGSAVANALIQVALVIAIGKLAYGVDLPADWLTVLVFTLAGVTAFASLGIAFSYVIPNFDAAPAYVNAVFLPVIFISGVFYSVSTLPAVLEVISQALPLTHVIDGLKAGLVGGGLGSELAPSRQSAPGRSSESSPDQVLSLGVGSSPGSDMCAHTSRSCVRRRFAGSSSRTLPAPRPSLALPHRGPWRPSGRLPLLERVKIVV